MNFKIGNKVRYISEVYWFPNDGSKEGTIDGFSDSGNLAIVSFNGFQTLNCYEAELKLVKEEKK